MSESDNVKVVQAGYEAFGRGDLDGLLALLDANVEWVSPGPDFVPTAGRRRGPEQVREFFRAVNDTYEFERFEPKTFVSQGDLVVVIGEDAVRVRATGKAIVEPWVHVFTVQNGRIVRFQEFIDMSASAEELRTARTHA
jgi:ketosteroid isomerase-like protein